MSSFDEQELTNYIEDRIEKALDSGFRLPVYFMAVGRNGGMAGGFCYRTPDEEKVCLEFHVEHYVGKGVELPCLITVVDESGKAKTARISRPGESDYWH